MIHGEQFHYLIRHGRQERKSHHYFDLDLKLTTTENTIAYCYACKMSYESPQNVILTQNVITFLTQNVIIFQRKL